MKLKKIAVVTGTILLTVFFLGYWFVFSGFVGTLVAVLQGK